MIQEQLTFFTTNDYDFVLCKMSIYATNLFQTHLNVLSQTRTDFKLKRLKSIESVRKVKNIQVLNALKCKRIM